MKLALREPFDPKAKRMFTTRISPDLLKELKHLSVDIETPISTLIENAIADLLKRYKIDDQPPD